MVDSGALSTACIRHIFISPGHNFFGRHGQPAGTHPAVDVAAVRCRAGLGLEGDRFFGYRPDYNGQVTFFAWETVTAARREFRAPDLRPEVFRRNVITQGVDLPALAGVRFMLGGIEFEGVGEAKPCYWMDQVVAPGAEVWLRGHGGLRAKILSDGELRCGEAVFSAPELLALG
ncbi:MAG: molybdenum cofactor biosysynthesis protein [Opitutaceae bacterium]|nr:molybdenum cofactor biosysynthesis protein [Opitutaceae bacterium]